MILYIYIIHKYVCVCGCPVEFAVAGMDVMLEELDEEEWNSDVYP